MFGTGASTSSFDDIELASTIVAVGGNSTENHPIVGDRIRQVDELIVIDQRDTELSACADLHLRPRPGARAQPSRRWAMTPCLERHASIADGRGECTLGMQSTGI